jgi:hypothetical protein
MGGRRRSRSRSFWPSARACASSGGPAQAGLCGDDASWPRVACPPAQGSRNRCAASTRPAPRPFRPLARIGAPAWAGPTAPFGGRLGVMRAALADPVRPACSVVDASWPRVVCPPAQGGWAFARPPRRGLRQDGSSAGEEWCAGLGRAIRPRRGPARSESGLLGFRPARAGIASYLELVEAYQTNTLAEPPQPGGETTARRRSNPRSGWQNRRWSLVIPPPVFSGSSLGLWP